MCTPSFVHLSFSIFTSVVVYSRTPPKNKNKNRTVDYSAALGFLFLSFHLYFVNEHSKSEAKKNAEHTRMYTIFSCILSQYSRRLLSILARPQRIIPQKTQEICCNALLLWDYSFFKEDCTKVRSKKKNAEHTRMYTILRNFSSQYSRRLLSILAHLELI